MEHRRSPDGVTSVSVRPYYTMLSRVYLALAMGFLVDFDVRAIWRSGLSARSPHYSTLPFWQLRALKG